MSKCKILHIPSATYVSKIYTVKFRGRIVWSDEIERFKRVGYLLEEIVFTSKRVAKRWLTDERSGEKKICFLIVEVRE